MAGERPNFSKILTGMLQDRKEVLYIPEKDYATHPQAYLLGASLEAGLDMYKELQNIYLKKQKSSSSRGKQKRYVTMERQTQEGLRTAEEGNRAEWTEGLYEMEDTY